MINWTSSNEKKFWSLKDATKKIKSKSQIKRKYLQNLITDNLYPEYRRHSCTVRI